MATITFDTHKFIKDLESAGIPELHAEAIARAQQESLQTAFEYRDLVTSLTLLRHWLEPRPISSNG